ncbi:electron transfer flavoprotein subunit alpha, partial [Pseudomonas sp. HMWF010]
MSDLIRRDPRAEWIARNRLHPLHAALQKVESSWMGPNGVIRKNPHGVGFIGPNGLKRIDRSGTQQGGSQKRSTASAVVQLPLHVIEQPAFYIAVVPDMVGGRLSSHDKDLLGLAHKLAGRDGAVVAVIFGEHKESAFDSNGVDRLLQFADDAFDGYAPEARVLALGALERQLSPRHWLLPDSRSGGGELGRRLAAKLGERPATRVWQVAEGMASGRAGAGR